MRTIVLFCYLGGLIGMSSLAASCGARGALVAENNKGVLINYGKNGVPNLIKGKNLSASMASDEAYQRLKACKEYGRMALYYLDRQRWLFRLISAHEEFVIAAVDTQVSGRTRVRLKQVHQTVPVWGKELSVHLNDNGQIYYVHGAYQPIPEGLSMETAITDATAADIVMRLKNDISSWRIEGVHQFIYAPSDDSQRLTFKVDLVHNDFYRESCFVDAGNGRILRCISSTPMDSVMSVSS